MANRRMFSKDIVESDIFLELPSTSQLLYFHLGMYADDRGYVSNARSVMKIIGATVGDLEVLINKKFVLLRGETLLLIKGWRINNTIQPTRLVETKYVEDLKKLFFDENGSYTEKSTGTPCQQLVNNSSTQISVVKGSEVESSLKEIKEDEVNPSISSSVVNDGSKEENKSNEWNGLNSHQIVDKFVEKSFIRDDEQLRSMYLEVIQRYIDKNGFYDSLKFAIETTDKTVDKKLGSSFYFAHFKSLLETLMGKSMAGGDDDDKPF